MVSRLSRYDRGVLLTTGLIGLAGFAVVWLTLCAHADRLVVWAGSPGGLSAAARAGLLAALFGAVAAGLVAFLVVLFRKARPLGLARRVELEYPEFRHALMTYLEIRRRGPRSRAELAVAKAVGKRAAARLTRVHPSRVAHTTWLVRVAAGAAGGCALAFVSALLTWNTFATSLERVAWPSSPRKPVTLTAIGDDIAPGNVTVLRRSDLTVTASIRGKQPEEAYLIWSEGDAEHQLAAARSEEPAPWTWTLEAVENDLTYSVEAGHDRSDAFRVRVVDAPVITGVEVRYEFPAYTGLAARTEPGGQIRAYVGSTVTVTAGTNKAIAKAKAEVSGRPAPPVRIANGRRGFSASFVLRSKGSYQLSYTDTDGFTNTEPVRYPMVALGDRAPSVEITDPGRDLELAADDVLPLAVEAEDDFGLSAVSVTYELNQVPHTIALPLAAGQKSRVGRLALSMESIGARPGNRIRYYASARDNKPDLPGEARTVDYYVTVKMPEPDEGERLALLPPDEIAKITEASDVFAELKGQLAEAFEEEAGPGEPGADRTPSADPEEGEPEEGGGEAAEEGPLDALDDLKGEELEIARAFDEMVPEAERSGEMTQEERDALADQIDGLADGLAGAVEDAREELAAGGEGPSPADEGPAPGEGGPSGPEGEPGGEAPGGGDGPKGPDEQGQPGAEGSGEGPGDEGAEAGAPGDQGAPGEGAGQGQGEGSGEGEGAGQGEGQGQGQGAGEGQGQGEGQGEGQGQGSGRGAGQGAGSTGGGGDSAGGAGAVPQRRDVTPDTDALNEQIARSAELVRWLNEISEGVRRGEVDPELLTRLASVGGEARRAGSSPFDRRETRGRTVGVLTREEGGEAGPGAGAEPHRERIHEGDGGPALVEEVTAEAVTLSADEVRRLIESGEVDVSPEYRALVERYFGALSEK